MVTREQIFMKSRAQRNQRKRANTQTHVQRDYEEKKSSEGYVIGGGQQQRVKGCEVGSVQPTLKCVILLSQRMLRLG